MSRTMVVPVALPAEPTACLGIFVAGFLAAVEAAVHPRRPAVMPALAAVRKPDLTAVCAAAIALLLALPLDAAAQSTLVQSGDVPAAAGNAVAPRSAAGAGTVAAPPASAGVAAPADAGAEPAAAPAGEAAEAAASSGPAAAPVLQEPAGSAVRVHLPHDLSPWGMFVASDWVVKAVMIGLAFASVVTWTVALVKSIELVAVGRRLRRDRVALSAAAGLAPAAELALGAEATALVGAAVEEVRLSAGLPAAGVKERVGSRLERVEAAVARMLRRGTGALATIGATAPFVGLFGTVWGIMNSFIGISEAQTTNLAIVAPGIAEALLATAIGLVAAIPAVVLYNHFARRIADRRQALADASAAVMRLVSRDLDRRVARGLAAAAE
jgi:biopolymer transport protein ExbB